MDNPREQLIKWIEKVGPILFQRMERKHKIQNDLISDIFQDIMVGLLANPRKFRDQKHFEAYFTKVFYFRLIDNLNFTKKFFQLQHVNEQSDLPSQEQTALLREVIGFIDELPIMQKKVMVRVVEGKSDETISKELKINRNTVRSHKRYARINLTNYLERR